MSAIERKFLPRNRYQPLSREEMTRRREEALAKQNQQTQVGFDRSAEEPETFTFDSKEPIKPPLHEEDFVFLGFARIFSGTLRLGQKLFVIQQEQKRAEMARVEVEELFLLMGRDLEEVSEVQAGNVVGIGGLEDHILKSGTLSSSPVCPTLSGLFFYAEPIVRVSIEPEKPAQLPALVKGLKLLNQADPCVRTFVQDTGEHVLVTAGEVHLERCIGDLKERFCTEIENFVVSEPIIPFMETIVPRPRVDRMREAIDFAPNWKDRIEIQTANKLCTFKIRAIPLSWEIVAVLKRYDSVLVSAEKVAAEKSAIGEKSEQSLDDEIREQFRKCKKELLVAFERTWKVNRGDSSCFWGQMNVGETLELVDRIWALGPRKARCNLLLNKISNYQKRPSVWTYPCEESPAGSEVWDFDQSVVSGFQLRCMAGPLCEEPLRGVGFVIEDWTISARGADSGLEEAYGSLSGQIMACVKEGCKQAFQAQPQRLLAAMYSCVIQATTEVLGKVYVVLSKRRGRVLSDQMKEGTNLFEITATLPVIESFGFADEIRKRTSGLASPQLVFSHWEVVDIDPFWVPTTEEELSHFGEKADYENQARKYMNSVRKRKGLAVDEKIVEFAEKQRNLAKKK